jgi:hypothetical protein
MTPGSVIMLWHPLGICSLVSPTSQHVDLSVFATQVAPAQNAVVDTTSPTVHFGPLLVS